MQTLKNKILIKPTKKLIFIISILMIISLNLFGEDKKELIRFEYYYYTNKIYHSTLKTEIIPSEYVFITTNSTNGNEYSYLYNLKTKEKKIFYIYKGYNDASDKYDYEYYDINGNLTTNWTDTNMEENGFYEITNNRFGETFYTPKLDSYSENIIITKTNNYIQKAYKYSLTQPEIINKKYRGIYLFKSYSSFYTKLCFQNEYYNGDYFNRFEESDLLNYDSNGRVIVFGYRPEMHYSYSYYDSWGKQWFGYNNRMYGSLNTVYFQLNNKSLIKPTWNEFTNNKNNKIFYTKEDIEENLQSYNVIAHTKYLWFIPIEEFEYYLLAD